jgi:hypothetical protein
MLVALFAAMVVSCGSDDNPVSPPDDVVYRIPIIVHVIHAGEPVGQGHNLSEERILNQIRILNEDYRRKEGTPGFNSHPDGGDARIEFVLAKQAPDGQPSDGINRIDTSMTDNQTEPGSPFNYYAGYDYWDPTLYLNVWTMPLPASTIDVILGLATGPNTALPGSELLEMGEPAQAEGILINAWHFGPSTLSSENNRGRTLTHEIGHFLGLLHPWGGRDCENNDYCDDTPPVKDVVSGCPAVPPMACDGQDVMIENYMNYTFDQCMNVFTNDQIARIHYVLNNTPERKSLLNSPGLGDSR